MILNPWDIDLQNPVAENSINNGLLAWWMVLPHSGLRGGVRLHDLKQRAPGRFDRAIGTATLQSYWKPNYFQFNKSERSYFNVGKKAQPASKITIAAWVYVSEISGTYGRFFTADDSSSYGALLYWVDGFGYRFGIYTTGWTLIASAAVGTSQWVHAVGTYDGANCRLYLNGRLAAGPTAQSGSINYNGRDSGIGGVIGSSHQAEFLGGRIRDLSVWDRALLAGEVVELYKEAKAGYPTLLNRGEESRRGYVAFVDTSYSLTCSAGSFTLSGQAAGSGTTRRMDAAPATFTISGQAAGVHHGSIVTAGAGAFVLSGQAASFITGFSLVAAAGSFTLTGQAADLMRATVLVGGAGSFTFTGNDAALGAGGTLVAAPGSFTLSGQTAELRHAAILACAAGSFTLTGQPAGYGLTRSIVASAGGFTLTGRSASLVYSGEGLAGYNIYSRDTIEGVATFIAFVASPEIEYLATGFDPDSEQWFHVKAITHCEVEDNEPVRLKRVAFDGDGNLILPIPNAPVGLRLTLGPSGQVIAAWGYLSNGQGAAPAQFNVYVAEDADPFDFGTPAETVAYSPARSFTADLGEFADGTLVRVVVRAQSEDETEELNENEIEIEADATAPDPALSIEVEVTAS